MEAWSRRNENWLKFTMAADAPGPQVTFEPHPEPLEPHPETRAPLVRLKETD